MTSESFLLIVKHFFFLNIELFVRFFLYLKRKNTCVAIGIVMYIIIHNSNHENVRSLNVITEISAYYVPTAYNMYLVFLLKKVRKKCLKYTFFAIVFIRIPK